MNSDVLFFSYGEKGSDRILEIRTDFLRFLRQSVGEAFFARERGTGLAELENTVPSFITEGIKRYNIINTVQLYNLNTDPEKRIMIAPEMINFRSGKNGNYYIDIQYYIPAEGIVDNVTI